MGLPANHPDVLRLLASGEAVDTTPGVRPARASGPSEADFQRAVIAFAERHGWRVFSLPDSRRVTAAGWPDLAFARDDRPAMFAELKRSGEVPRPEQVWWLDRLRRAGAEVFVWRPDAESWAEIERVLG